MSDITVERFKSVCSKINVIWQILLAVLFFIFIVKDIFALLMIPSILISLIIISVVAMEIAAFTKESTIGILRSAYLMLSISIIQVLCIVFLWLNLTKMKTNEELMDMGLAFVMCKVIGAVDSAPLEDRMACLLHNLKGYQCQILWISACIFIIGIVQFILNRKLVKKLQYTIAPQYMI